MRYSASEKDCSNSYTDTVRVQTKYVLPNQSVISAKNVLYTVNTELKQINVLDKTVLWENAWMQIYKMDRKLSVNSLKV